MQTYAFRLKPEADLREEIDKFVTRKNIKAGVVLACVGGLEKVNLRMPGAKEIKTWEQDFEIVSLTGTAEPGNSHLHISVSDIEGKVIGGHLQEGNIVRTTAEVVIGELENTEFTREHDPDTGFEELAVK